MTVLGYDYNDGGINNQKLAIIGLFVAAYHLDDGHKTVYLPNLYSKDQREDLSTFELFGDIFMIEPLRAFAQRWGIDIVERPKEFFGDRETRNGWNFFNRGAIHIGDTVAINRSTVCVDISADLLRSLVPKSASDPLCQLLCQEIFFSRSIKTVMQLRIEDDWKSYSRYNLAPVIHHNEDYLLNAEEIVAKFAFTRDAGRFPDDSNTIYVTCDERYIGRHKDDIRSDVKATTGVDIVFKSDILSDPIVQQLKPIEASLIDFEVAKMSKNFIGLSRSSFANLVCLERHIDKFTDRSSDYIYNRPGPELCLRTDMGSNPNFWLAASEG